VIPERDVVTDLSDDPFGDAPFDFAPAAPRISDLARATGPDLLTGLNPEQRAAVEATEGPVLVLAGAGTGKTRVLTTRLAHLLATGRARPWEILAVTFTNKAAKEMRERIAAQIGPSSEGLRWLGTFHSVAAQILRRHAEQAAQRHAQQHPADNELALPLRAHEALVTRHLARRKPAAQALQLGVADRVRIHHPERSLRHLELLLP